MEKTLHFSLPTLREHLGSPPFFFCFFGVVSNTSYANLQRSVLLVVLVCYNVFVFCFLFFFLCVFFPCIETNVACLWILSITNTPTQFSLTFIYRYTCIRTSWKWTPPVSDAISIWHWGGNQQMENKTICLSCVVYTILTNRGRLKKMTATAVKQIAWDVLCRHIFLYFRPIRRFQVLARNPVYI